MDRNILFDFDGTIADTGPGITASVKYTFKKHKINPVPEDAHVKKCIGPPLVPLLKTVLGRRAEEIDIESMAAGFREHYTAEGLFMAELYEGIRGTLDELHNDYTLYIVSSKPGEFIKKLLPKLGAEKFFRAVYGPGTGFKAKKKKELIHDFLNDTGAKAGECLMIGDKPDDVEAAEENKIKTVGVTYGFGTKEELVKAGAVAFADTPGSLLGVVKGVM